jgi:hypothetical protein
MMVVTNSIEFEKKLTAFERERLFHNFCRDCSFLVFTQKGFLACDATKKYVSLALMRRCQKARIEVQEANKNNPFTLG